jgi:hypothetical protein
MYENAVPIIADPIENDAARIGARCIIRLQAVRRWLTLTCVLDRWRQQTEEFGDWTGSAEFKFWWGTRNASRVARELARTSLNGELPSNRSVAGNTGLAWGTVSQILEAAFDRELVNNNWLPSERTLRLVVDRTWHFLTMPETAAFADALSVVGVFDRCELVRLSQNLDLDGEGDLDT